MLHKILSKVATSHLRKFGSARVAFSGFNQVAREEYFYRSADLFHLNNWIDKVNAVRTFKIRCYQFGWDKIHLAGERGLLLAKYVDGTMNLAFSVDDRGLSSKSNLDDDCGGVGSGGCGGGGGSGSRGRGGGGYRSEGGGAPLWRPLRQGWLWRSRWWKRKGGYNGVGYSWIQ
ncbi:hypothetical protein N665_0092s0040 [Sinapis alba]|nr:hypothetical protein N665_0092s0040 [Sinapis alba]